MATLLENVLHQMIGLGVSNALLLAFTVYAARALGVVDFGKYTFALAYGVLWAVFMDGGTSVVATREVSSERRLSKIVKAIFPCKLALSIAGLVGVLGVAGLLRLDLELLVVSGLVGVGVGANTFLRYSFAFFRGHAEIRFEAFHIVLQKVVLSGLGTAALLLHLGVVGVGAAYAVSFLAVAMLALAMIHRRYGVALIWRPQGCLPVVRGLLGQAFPIALVELFTQVYLRIGTVLLQAMQGLAAVGQYGAAYRLIEGLVLVPTAFMTALFPRLAWGARHDAEFLRREFHRGWRCLWLLGCVVLGQGWLWGDRIVPLIYGRAYGRTAPLLNVLMGALFVMHLNYLLTQTLVAVGKERRYALFVGICAAANVAFNLLLIPRFAAMGAAWATLLTEILLLGLCVAGLWGLAIEIPLWSSLGWLAAAVVLAGTLRYTATAHLGAAIVAAALACPVFLWPAIRAARERPVLASVSGP